MTAPNRERHTVTVTYSRDGMYVRCTCGHHSGPMWTLGTGLRCPNQIFEEARRG